MKKQLTIAILAASFGILTACGTASASSASLPSSIQIEDTSSQVITVTSSETVQITPDIAQLVFAIHSQEKTAKDCQHQNMVSLNQVLEYLKTQGIADTSVKTSNYSLNPIYDWKNGQTLTGYEMTTNITISDVPLENAGALITSVIENGANDVESVTYLSSKYDDCYQEALQTAIASAKTKAEALASAGGRSLGAMVRVEEYTPNTSTRYTKNLSSNSAMEEKATADVAMDVMPGQLDVKATVTVDFAIQ